MVLLSDKHPIDLTIGQELPPTFHYAWVILKVYGAPAVYADHGVHVVGHHDHGWRDGRRHAKHERKRRKAERRYYRHLHRLEHQHARAHRHCRH